MAATFLNIGMSFDVMDASEVIVREEQMIPKTHEYLFHFLDADLSRLEAYGRAYLSCLDSGAEADRGVAQRMFEELFALHPFFRSCPANAAALMNQSFADYIGSRWEDEAQQEAAMAKVYVDQYLYGSELTEWLTGAQRTGAGRIFERLYILQEQIRQWVFLVLDNTNSDLAKLSSAQRNALYSLLHGNYLPLLETRVEKSMRQTYSVRALSAKLDFQEDFWDSVNLGLAQMHKDATATPESVLELIQALGQVTEDCECHTYITDTLDDLLKFEVYGMTQADMRIKRCKYCGRYFIVDKGNVEYCDPIAAGETKPCSEIGKMRTYEKKIAKGGSTMALYRKAYKTHFARIRTGTMTREQFDAWKEEATAKRLLTEAGGIELEEFAAWLKK